MTQSENKRQLIEKITPMLRKNGVKNLTMDTIARQLGISKRTLYEVFDSKDAMVEDVLTHMYNAEQQQIKEAAMASDNVMEAMALGLKLHQRFLSETDVALLRDIDRIYPHLRHKFEKLRDRNAGSMLDAFRIGVEQGVFRKNTDYRILLTLFQIQLESLKRMEDLFPPDVTLLDAYNAISIGLLRSIATAKGIEILDKHLDYFDTSAVKS